MFWLSKLCQHLRQQGKLEEAETIFEESLAIELRNAFALRDYAETLLKQGKLEEAGAKFKSHWKLSLEMYLL